MAKNKALQMTAKVIAAIGGVNWGLVGVGELVDKNLNVLNYVLGSVPMVEALAYIAVGAATGVWIFNKLK